MSKKICILRNKLFDNRFDETSVFSLIQAALWQTEIGEVTQEDYEIMQRHAISTLPASICLSQKTTPELFRTWQRTILQHIVNNANCRYVQASLPLTMPYVVLKGTSAAQYYPNPEYRLLGDIDIMTKREDAESACKLLLQEGYKEVTCKNDEEEGRHREFQKNGVSVEVHYSFAAMNDPEKARKFDDLIINNINDTHVLPDLINGLVLIEHVNQHLENGLGLRQIIDWMMFVDKCLSDEYWSTFKKLVAETGLETLTIVTTRMCEMYLGLSEHFWCKTADEKLCESLMVYIMGSGNFGNQRTDEERKTYSRMSRINHLFASFREMQQKGLQEWKSAQHSALKPFAWIWKSSQYFKDFPSMVAYYRKAKKRKKMLEKLGVKRKELGIAKYQNGEYFIPRE